MRTCAALINPRGDLAGRRPRQFDQLEAPMQHAAVSRMHGGRFWRHFRDQHAQQQAWGWAGSRPDRCWNHRRIRRDRLVQAASEIRRNRDSSRHISTIEASSVYRNRTSRFRVAWDALEVPNHEAVDYQTLFFGDDRCPAAEAPLRRHNGVLVVNPRDEPEPAAW